MSSQTPNHSSWSANVVYRKENKVFEVVRAGFPDDLSDVLDLYREYIQSTTVDLAFQSNEEEFRLVPEKYSTEESKTFLLKRSGAPVGCAAFRRLSESVCEMKRVYIQPSARGYNQGRRLIDKVLQEAIVSGYKKICLDVLPEFKTALRLYESYGFIEHPPVTHNPVLGTRFLGLNLEGYSKALRQTSC